MFDAKLVLMNGNADQVGTVHHSSSASATNALTDKSSLSSSGILDLGTGGTPAKGLTAHVRYEERVTYPAAASSTSDAGASDYAQTTIEAANSKTSASSWTTVVQFASRPGGSTNSSQSSSQVTKRFITNKRYLRGKTTVLDAACPSSASSSSAYINAGKIHLHLSDEGYENL